MDLLCHVSIAEPFQSIFYPSLYRIEQELQLHICDTLGENDGRCSIPVRSLSQGQYNLGSLDSYYRNHGL